MKKKRKMKKNLKIKVLLLFIRSYYFIVIIDKINLFFIERILLLKFIVFSTGHIIRYFSILFNMPNLKIIQNKLA
jgi:hypothetical protein